MPAKSCLLSARLRPRVPRSARVLGLAIRMTSVLCSWPSAPMLTSLTIQATFPLPQREYRPENTSSSLAPPILQQSPMPVAKSLGLPAQRAGVHRAAFIRAHLGPRLYPDCSHCPLMPARAVHAVG